jgi:PDZ domain-containing protein
MCRPDVRQKVAAAERAGAEYFLVPAANYAEAKALASRIKVIEVSTAGEAVAFLHTLPDRDR